MCGLEMQWYIISKKIIMAYIHMIINVLKENRILFLYYPPSVQIICPTFKPIGDWMKNKLWMKDLLDLKRPKLGPS